jgi:plasmid maintenance system killer protein
MKNNLYSDYADASDEAEKRVEGNKTLTSKVDSIEKDANSKLNDINEQYKNEFKQMQSELMEKYSQKNSNVYSAAINKLEKIR